MTERRRQLLEEKKSELQIARDMETHQLCERLIKETPALLEEAATNIIRENPLLKKTCEPSKTLSVCYQEKPMLRAMVDQYVMEHSPQQFLTIRERYDLQIAVGEEKTESGERASAS